MIRGKSVQASQLCCSSFLPMAVVCHDEGMTVQAVQKPTGEGGTGQECVMSLPNEVVEIKNNYDIIWTKGKEVSSGIFNGDIGRIIAINHNASFMKIDFDGRISLYPFDNIGELELAYAITVHKSQGSEFDAVIMPVCNVIPQLSYRNLLYTAVTRAKNRIILVGTKQQIKEMVDNDKKTRRYSFLKHLLLKD